MAAVNRPLIAPDKLEGLPLTNRVLIPAAYLDEMGHMNIQYYIHIFDRAAWGLFHHIGITYEHLQARRSGMFALQQHIHYLAEVNAGETVAVRSRVLGLSAKRIHFIHFMVNETTGALASTLEALASYADMTTRRTASFPPEIRDRLNALLQTHAALDWPAPTCGIISP